MSASRALHDTAQICRLCESGPYEARFLADLSNRRKRREVKRQAIREIRSVSDLASLTLETSLLQRQCVSALMRAVSKSVLSIHSKSPSERS